MAKKRATLTDLLNDLTFRVIFDKFRLIAVNMFEWEGLPEGVSERYLEQILFEEGKAIFVNDEGVGHLILHADQGCELNVYNEPLNWFARGNNYNVMYPADQVVIIDNNILRLPTGDFIIHYVNKIVEAERTMDVNIKRCKTPYIFACGDKDVLTLKKMFQDIDGNVPAIFADKGLQMELMSLFQTGVKFLGNELMDYKNSVEGELLTFLGQNNNPVDKKERVITDEARSNNQLIRSFAELGLAARQAACEAINAMFGTNMSVKLRQSEIVEENDDPMEEGQEGDEE